MRKNLMKVAVLAGLGLVVQLAATDFRAPIATQMGPLHYTFDKLHKKKSNLTYFTTAHFRETNEAFIKHGTETHPLSELIFGKSDFTIGESFGGGEASVHPLPNVESYNPYLDLTHISPRVSYSEAGVFFGANWDYPVWNNKGRIGIRGSLPIRWVRMERDNEAEGNAAGLQYHVVKQDQRHVDVFDASDVSGPASHTIGQISSYRLSLLKSLKYLDQAGKVISYYRTDANGVVTLGSEYNKAANEYGASGYGFSIPFVLIKSAGLPIHKGGALLIQNAGSVDNPSNDGQPGGRKENVNTRILYPNAARTTDINPPAPRYPYADNQLVDLLPDASIPAGRAAVFVAGQDYTNLDLGNFSSCPDSNGLTSNDLWVTTIHGMNKEPIDTSKDEVEFIDNLLSYYGTDVEEWLYGNGFVMATDEQTGLGDIPVELFYEHSFNDSWRGELCFGVKFPTGNGGSDYAGNPYRVQLGNGSHYEIKLGILGAWQALRCMNVKLDLSYNFALKATEERKAAYRCATIKNFGPRADASVDWSYFLGNFDFNFTHPKTKKINGMIGYQLYYKTEDHISFKCYQDPCPTLCPAPCCDPCSNPCPCATRSCDPCPTPCPTPCRVKKPCPTPCPIKKPCQDPCIDQTMSWLGVPMVLDNDVARMNTEQWAHRIRLEGSYNLSKYCTASVGGLYTFAGKNMPVEADVHCAWQVRF